jgi:hypothetical protein
MERETNCRERTWSCGVDLAGRQGFFKRTSRNTNKDGPCSLKLYNRSDLRSSDPFIRLRRLVTVFGFCWRDVTRNVTHRGRLPSSSRRKLALTIIALISKMTSIRRRPPLSYSRICGVVKEVQPSMLGVLTCLQLPLHGSVRVPRLTWFRLSVVDGVPPRQRRRAPHRECGKSAGVRPPRAFRCAWDRFQRFCDDAYRIARLRIAGGIGSGRCTPTTIAWLRVR